MTTTHSHDIMVCEDCYFAHHYGATPTITGTNHLAPQPIGRDEVAGYLADGWTVRWFAGESDIPCDREPLGKCHKLELADNTDSETGEGIQDFSSSACEGCGSRLGGARYRLAVFIPTPGDIIGMRQ